MKKIFPLFFFVILISGFIAGSGCISAIIPDIQIADPISGDDDAQETAQTAWRDPEESIRTFLGDPTARVVFERNITNIPGGKLEIFRVNDDRFTVDTKTGTIIGASFISREPAESENFTRAAEPIARECAISRFAGFASRNMQLTEARKIDHGAMGIEYSFIWQEQSYGINNGNIVAVSVSPSGNILSYHARDRPAPVLRAAKISKMVANATAVDYVIANTKITNITDVKSTSALYVMLEDENRVAWRVNLEILFRSPSMGMEDHRGGEVYVDAITGEVVKYNPCM